MLLACDHGHILRCRTLVILAQVLAKKMIVDPVWMHGEYPSLIYDKMLIFKVLDRLGLYYEMRSKYVTFARLFN